MDQLRSTGGITGLAEWLPIPIDVPYRSEAPELSYYLGLQNAGNL